ncbi:MAG: CvpA family protein [Verrucomicrobia bacterium]|nr:CvpA family protein [Verrucomicrobiota bacterium]
MTIWILAVVLFGFLAWMGLLKGAIRVTVMLAGLVLAAMLALPLAPLIKPLFPKMGVENPYWLWLLPPVTIFFLIQFIFTGIAFMVHRQVALHFKYKTDDIHRLRWERLNNHLGMCVGLGAGCVYLVLLGLIIYVSGYLTNQVVATDNVPLPLQYLNSARADLTSTGLDKLVSKIDPTPPTYYEASDIVGLVYHNPLLQGRLSAYPGFLTLEERPELQEISNDKDFIELFQQQQPITKVINYPKVQALAKNAEIVQALASLDLKDLRQYLETGVSPKFEEEKILGRWQLNLGATLVELRKTLTTLPASSWKNVKKALTLSAMSFTAMPDNKVLMKVQSKDEIMKLTQPPVPAATGAAGATGEGGAGASRGSAPTARSIAARADPNAAAANQAFQQRYGRLLQPAQPTPPPVVVVAAPAAPPSPILKLIISGEGSWKNDGEKYKLTVKDGKDQKLEGTVRGDRLILAKDDLRLIFERE